MKKLLICTFLTGLSALLYAQTGRAEPLFELGTGKFRSIIITLYRGTGEWEAAPALFPEEVAIPPQISNMPVTAIGQGAFRLKGLTRVGFPQEGRIGSIGDRAFADNRLETLALPESVKNIGTEAFRNNNIIAMNIPRGLQSIGDGAFENNNLSHLAVPENALIALRKIGAYAFRKNSLNTLDLTGFVNLRAIGNGAFAENSLTRVDLPGGLRYIGEYAFRDNRDLRTIVIGNNVNMAVSSVDRGFFIAYNQVYDKSAGIYNKQGDAWTRVFSSTRPARK